MIKPICNNSTYYIKSNAKSVTKGISVKLPQKSKAIILSLMALASANFVFPNTQNKNINSNNISPNRNESFSDNYGPYGYFYAANIPQNEDVSTHYKLINQLSEKSEKIQGCKISNLAFLNGISLDDLQNKMINPAQKLINGEKFGKNQNTLVLIAFDDKCDPRGAFNENLQDKTFTSKHSNIAGVFNYHFEKSFFDNYDNIVFIQPSTINADDAMNNTFEKLNNCLDKGAAIDIAIMGHGVGKNSIRLHKDNAKYYNEQNYFDTSDFEGKGDSYAQNIKNLFQNSIDNNINPRIIGIGCNTEFLQDCMKNIMNDEYKKQVKVFGTPYNTNRSYAIGFNDGNLEINVPILPIKGKKGLIIKITDSGETFGKTIINREKFTIDTALANKIVDDYTKHKIRKGTICKPNGMVMQYELIQY